MTTEMSFRRSATFGRPTPPTQRSGCTDLRRHISEKACAEMAASGYLRPKKEAINIHGRPSGESKQKYQDIGPLLEMR